MSAVYDPFMYRCCVFVEETFALVSWPEENNNVSVISDVRNRISAPLSVGELCCVGYGKKTFPAMVGKYVYVRVYMYNNMYMQLLEVVLTCV